MSSNDSDRSGDRDLGGDSDARGAGDERDERRPTEHEPAEHEPAEHEPAEHGLLAEMRALRRRARADRHAYWFPLILFGLLACASLPYYLQPWPVHSGVYSSPVTQMPALGGIMTQDAFSLANFWLAALLGGLLATEAWYWWRGRRAGLTMPHRAALITTAALTLAAIVIPLGWDFSWLRAVAPVLPADLLVRGTLPLFLIGPGLLVLAWTERSWGLAGIALVYSAAALLSALYDEENLLDRIGWVLSPRTEDLPNVILPAAILLISGVAAFATSRPRRGMTRQRLASGELT